MREFLKRSGRWLSIGWFWPLVLLALPNCSLGSSGLETPPAFDPGPEPRTSAIMCYIPKPGTTQCATQDEANANVSTAHAAVALAQGEGGSLVLDYAPNACQPGLPMRTEVYGSFPDGLTVCLNCDEQIPKVFADANVACVAKCKDVLRADGAVTETGVDDYCERNVHVATNFDKGICFEGVCSKGGTPLDPPPFDPRRNAEAVKWIVDPNDGTAATGSDLQRTANTTGSGDSDFNAGSEAAQVIMNGDAWVELQAGDPLNPNPIETSLSHVLGLSNCGFPCDANNPPADTDRSLNDIEFALSLNKDGNVYVIENPGLQVHGPFGAPYTVGERFRVRVVDNHDGKAVIAFSRGVCTPGVACNDDMFFTSGTLATYPLRIDTSFREKDALLKNVAVVRIQ